LQKVCKPERTHCLIFASTAAAVSAKKLQQLTYTGQRNQSYITVHIYQQSFDTDRLVPTHEPNTKHSTFGILVKSARHKAINTTERKIRVEGFAIQKSLCIKKNKFSVFILLLWQTFVWHQAGIWLLISATGYK
jgi:hypothetical protein